MSLIAPGPAAVAGTIAQQTLTVGVEEEFLLLDPGTGQNTALADAARDALPAGAREHSRVEFRRSMMEMVTPVCTSLPQLRRHLTANRSAAAAAAASVGAGLVPVGATPIGEPDRTVEDTPRFHAISTHYGPIAHDPALCGCHVHVGVPDPEVAVQVCNHLRPWLPVIQAIAANSPFHARRGHPPRQLAEHPAGALAEPGTVAVPGVRRTLRTHRRGARRHRRHARRHDGPVVGAAVEPVPDGRGPGR